MYVWTYYSERFMNIKRFEKWDSLSKLSLEIKGSEYI